MCLKKDPCFATLRITATGSVQLAVLPLLEVVTTGRVELGLIMEEIEETSDLDEDLEDEAWDDREEVC